MFCSKCGKEIMNEAVVCPNCGCATSNYNTQQSGSTTNGYSNDYLIIKQFSEQTVILRNLGIIATVLMFGIGIIFTIILYLKLQKNKIPNIKTTNPVEVAEFESAKRRYKLANTLCGISLVGFVFAIASGMVIGLYIGLNMY